MTKENRKNYWPHAIVAIIIAGIIAGGFTIKIAIDNPAVEDNFYMDKYQKVENNINDIMEKQKIFDENYKLSYETKKFVIGKENSFIFAISDLKQNKNIKNANIKFLLTRPDSTEFDQKFELKNTLNDKFVINNIKVNKPGRWQILTKITIDGKIGFNKYEVYATK